MYRDEVDACTAASIIGIETARKWRMEYCKKHGELDDRRVQVKGTGSGNELKSREYKRGWNVEKGRV